MKTKILIGLIFLFLFPLFSFAQDQTQWPTFQGNNARTGFSDSKGPSKPDILWQLTAGDFRRLNIDPRGINRPIIYKNKVFFASGAAIAVELHTGKILWHSNLDPTNLFPVRIIAGEEKIFVVANNSTLIKTMTEGYVYALNEASGQLLWKYQTQKSISNSIPVFADGKVFVGDDSGTLYAIEAKSGELVWKKFLDAEQIHSSPAYDNGIVFVGTEGTAISNKLPSHIFALNAQTGSVIWKFQVDYLPDKVNLVHATPAILDGIVYVGCENGYFYALRANDGHLIWKKKTTASGERVVGASAPAALAYGKIFVRLWEGKMQVLSQKDGEILWERIFGRGSEDFSPIVADGKIYIGHHSFYSLNAENGKIVWEQKFPGRVPALADGILVVPNADVADGSPDYTSVLIAYSESETQPQSPQSQPQPRSQSQPQSQSQETPSIRESAKESKEPQEIVKKEFKEGTEVVHKNIFQKIREAIINFFKRIF